MTTTPKTLTVFECHRLLDALLCKNAPHKSFRKGLRNYTMAVLMLDAGLRVGEVVALEMSDLYYGGAVVENLLIRPEIAKNKTERTVPLSGRIRNALRTLYDECPWMADWSLGEYVFEIVGGRGHLTTRQVERIIRAAASKSIGRPVHPHVLRHTFASRLMRKTNARIVQELLGHKHMTSTQIYTHPNEDDKKEAIGRLNVEEGKYQINEAGRLRAADVPNGGDTAAADGDVR